MLQRPTNATVKNHLWSMVLLFATKTDPLDFDRNFVRRDSEGETADKRDIILDV